MQVQVRCLNCLEIIDFGDGIGVAVLCPTCGYEVQCQSRIDSGNQPSLELDEETSTEFLAELDSGNGQEATTNEHASETTLGGRDSEIPRANRNVWDSVEIRPKVRPKSPSFARLIIPPILGGIAAIPISLAILWYGFGRDIGNAAPKVAKFAPWLVPEALRGGLRGRVASPQKSQREESKDRRFGALGSPSTRSTIPPEPVGAELTPREFPETQGAGRGFLESMADIQAIHDTWETNPIETREQMLASVYRHAIALVGSLTIDDPANNDLRDAFRESARELLNQAWFVEAISEANEGNLPDIYPPAVLDYVAWVANDVQWERSDAGNGQLALSPSSRIAAKQVKAIANDSLANRFTDDGTDGREKRYVVLGQVIHRDVNGYVVRVDAVLP